MDIAYNKSHGKVNYDNTRHLQISISCAAQMVGSAVSEGVAGVESPSLSSLVLASTDLEPGGRYLKQAHEAR